MRRYVRECLLERTDLRLLEAATVTAAVTLVEHQSPELLVVDEPASNVLEVLSRMRAILIVDDVPQGTPASETRLRLLARPFTAEELIAEVGELLG
jgi:CheY-like chemotaxis protein